MAVAAGGCDDPTFGSDAAVIADAGPQSDARLEPGKFTVIVLPDTQYYTRYFPEFFEAQVDWIVAQKNVLGIAFVLHEGDIVEDDVQGQWARAATYLHKLDDLVPYVLASGNHDLKPGTRDAVLMNTYFPVSRFMMHPWFKGTFEPNKIQNTYQILDANGQDWLVLTLEFGPRDEALAWADGVLTAHPALPAIIVTHAYMYTGNVRYDRARYPTQLFSPHHYGLPGTVNDGEEMWQKLVSQHDNVKFVLSGHMTWPGASRLYSTRPSGSHVHEILANYQGCAAVAPCDNPDTGQPIRGGEAFLRIMRFDTIAHRVSVQTYSPALDAYKTDGDNQFELELD